MLQIILKTFYILINQMLLWNKHSYKYAILIFNIGLNILNKREKKWCVSDYE